MPTASQFSEANFVNSIGTYLADKIIAAGYFIYWQQQDMVENLDGVYQNYTTAQETYLALPQFKSRLDAAKGILTLRFGEVPAVPSYVTRPTTDGRITDVSAVPIPMLAISVADPLPLGNVELGTRLQWFFRRLTVHGFGRDGFERGVLADLFAYDWFRHDQPLVLRDHTAGSLSVIDSVRVVSPRVDRATDVDGAEATTYELFFNAGLEYQA